MVLGTVLVLAALSLFLRNQQESKAAGITAGKILAGVKAQIEEQVKTREDRQDGASPSDLRGERQDGASLTGRYETMMAEAEIDGYVCVGYLSVPAIELELPVMSRWDDTLLKAAPCRYSGSAVTGDLAICAHNYAQFFGRLPDLSSGDKVYFVDMSGVVWRYEVARTEILLPDGLADRLADMMAGDCDLTLFTCTYDGGSRVAVYCERAGG